MTISALGPVAVVVVLMLAACQENAGEARAGAEPAPRPAPRAAPTPSAPGGTDGVVTRHTGVLRGGMMAIGGETSGWVLETAPGAQLELDVSMVRDEARALDGQRVTAEGTMTEKRYVERGAVKVLRVTGLRAGE
ncbi:MAG TPA: hypothetical protein VD963_05860 [Phycisphaerales bacterium]|nr:hypothetical protein [Phycisphaerales bacterium]